MTDTTNYCDAIDSPLGVINICASSQGITSVSFDHKEQCEAQPNDITELCKQQLIEYFSGQRQIFDIPLDQNGTDFQRSVWAQLLKIPFGKIASYRDVAVAIDNPKAVRAVGAANGRNPIAVIVPCHRVIGSNNSLTGYASGLDRKEWLLKHEGAMDTVSQTSLFPSLG